MSKDGPAISGGMRFGGLNALRANLPSNSINPRGPLTGANAKARLNLFKFCEYRERVKALGKPVPVTHGISGRRAQNLRRIAELEDEERKEKRVKLRVDGNIKFELVCDSTYQWYRLREENLATGYVRWSIKYGSAARAKRALKNNFIYWLKDE